ncbi:MAG: DUF2975 domain-containing protein [Robiginitomaculum sp.]|nr:DUF2975 domain-containing protein [Robiginitomaculum sp.]
MGVETLYPDEDESGSATSKASPAIAFLNVLLTIIWWAGWVFLILFVLVFLYAGLSFLGVESLKRSFEVTTPLMALVSSASVIVVALVFLIIVKQLRKICQTLVTGDPFVPENANRLRIIWIAVASGEVIRLASTIIISLVSKTTDNAVQAPDLRVYVWFMVLALIILAEVFREGARMRQEQKLTV